MDPQLFKYLNDCSERLGKGFDLFGVVVNWLEDYYDSGKMIISDPDRFEAELKEFRKLVEEVRFTEEEIKQMQALTAVMKKKS